MNVNLENSHIANAEFSCKANRVVEPVLKVPVTWVVENNHAQDDGPLQHGQRVALAVKVVEQLGLGEEGLLRS